MRYETLWNGIRAVRPEHGMPLTADAFVLSDFVSPPRGGTVCDLGCGAGAILMMLAADDPTLSLTGVERDTQSAADAEACIKENGLEARCHILCADWRELSGKLSFGVWDAVVSNPPYYPPAPESDASRTARFGTVQSLCDAAAALLKNGGCFFVIYRAERLAELFSALCRAGLEPKHLRFVRHRADSRRTLVLCRAVKGGGCGLYAQDDLILYGADGTETEECRRIYHRE